MTEQPPEYEYLGLGRPGLGGYVEGPTEWVKTWHPDTPTVADLGRAVDVTPSVEGHIEWDRPTFVDGSQRVPLEEGWSTFVPGMAEAFRNLNRAMERFTRSLPDRKPYPSYNPHSNLTPAQKARRRAAGKAARNARKANR